MAADTHPPLSHAFNPSQPPNAQPFQQDSSLPTEPPALPSCPPHGHQWESRDPCRHRQPTVPAPMLRGPALATQSTPRPSGTPDLLGKQGSSQQLSTAGSWFSVP